MYTILIRNTNDAIASNRTRIMQRSKLVDDLHFLVEPIYNDYDMQDFTVTLEYRLPVSHEYRTEILVLSEELYKEYYEYKLPIDTCITKEPGDVEMLITFSKAEMDADGKVIQRVRKISPCYLTVIELGALANQLADTQDLIAESKADDLSYKDNTLQLLANGKPIGTSHILDQQTEFDVVEFGNSDDPNEPDSDANTFIEF